MIDDDDALDPVIADRFRPLDDVAVPDTWNPSVMPLAGRRRPAWMIGAAAASVIALIVGFVLLRSGDDAGDLATVDATTVATPSVATSATPDAPPNALATAFPSVVAPGQLLTITPSTAVQRYCLDVVMVLPVGAGALIGEVFDGNDWEPALSPSPVTYSCDGDVTDSALPLRAPAVPDGDYRFCIAAGDAPEGCALVNVSASAPPVPLDDALATADPVVVAPGSVVAITPSESIKRYCTDIVAVLPVGDGRVLGQILGGDTWAPAPDGPTGPTWPACLGETTDAALAITVPDMPTGFYRFCIGSSDLPEGCAVVTVQTASLLATASPSEVAPGDATTIASAGPVPRLCGGVIVRIFDATRTAPLLHVVDPATGASELPPFPGGWEAPDCVPEPSDAPLTLVVPELPAGVYAFCLSVEPIDAACASVSVTAERAADPSVPPGSTEPPVASTGAPGFVSIEPGSPVVVDVITHCGLEYLVPEIDGRLWMTDEAAGTFEWGPPEWAAVSDQARELIELELVLSEDRNTLTATANGRSVTYRPLTPEDVQFRCA